MDSVLTNKNPIIYPKRTRRSRTDQSSTDEFSVEPIDQLEIFDILNFCYSLLRQRILVVMFILLLDHLSFFFFLNSLQIV